MGIRSRRRRGAFTLIELMIVVAITGILAMLAAYGVRKYISHSKSSEARNSLGRIANAAVIAYEKENMGSPVMSPGTSTNLTRALCKTASQTVPSSPTMIAGKKYQSLPGEWTVDPIDTGFTCLQFTIDEPQYYVYSYAATGSSNPGDSFAAVANGDLNGDGVLSTFQLIGAINGSYVMNVAPNMTEITPEE